LARLILVSNAAYQMNRTSLQEMADEEWDYTFTTTISAVFHLCKAAVPHMAPGSSIIGSSSANSDSPSPTLAPYVAPVYVLLASDDGSRLSGAGVAVTGGRPIRWYAVRPVHLLLAGLVTAMTRPTGLLPLALVALLAGLAFAQDGDSGGDVGFPIALVVVAVAFALIWPRSAGTSRTARALVTLPWVLGSV
jgi:hypothetical protein